MEHVLEVFIDLVVSQHCQGQVLTMAEYLLIFTNEMSFDCEPNTLVLKELMNFAELGPLVWSTAPALMHQVQDFFGHVAARSS